MRDSDCDTDPDTDCLDTGHYHILENQAWQNGVRVGVRIVRDFDKARPELHTFSSNVY